MITITVPDWTIDALCTQSDPDAWFPDHTGTTAESRMVKAICQQCPVVAECLQVAIDNHEIHGIWGGLTPMERRRLWQGRKVA